MPRTYYTINGRIIEVSRDHYRNWVAIDINAYDGAPDGDTNSGSGKTAYEAIVDLLWHYDEELTDEDISMILVGT